jgi:hypothetical protein
MTKINIDASGWACNNQFGIQGAWYCYADKAGTSNCTGTGAIPYNMASNAMCINGTTSTSTDPSAAFGAGLGLVLNQTSHLDQTKNPFNATSKNLVGFAITISGDSGGSVLNINLPPALTPAGESAAVTVPGVSSASSPITYNILFSDAIISDQTTVFPKLDPTKLTDVQVAIPGADGVAHSYNFCVTKLLPIMAAPAAPGSLASDGPTFNEGKQILIGGIGPYGVQNDPFNVGGDPMTMQVSFGGGQAGFTATPSFTSGGVGAFPSVAYGWIHGGNFVGGNDPARYVGGKTIGALASVTSSWSFTAGGGNWDAAYDCWLGGNANSVNAGFELMVWLARNGVNPIGGQNAPVTIAGAPGTWTVSTGTNPTGQPVVSYVSSSNMMSVTNLNLLPYFQDAANSSRAPGLTTGTFLLGCQAGFELYNPGTWTTSSYRMSIQ